MVNKRNLLFFSPLIFLVIGISAYLIWLDGEPKCYGKTCNNSDAKQFRCNKKVITLAEKVIEDKSTKNKIELRYSGICDASWVRAGVPANSTLYLEDKKGNKIDSWQVPDEKRMIAGPQYGNMGFGKNYKACARLPDGKTICTQ